MTTQLKKDIHTIVELSLFLSVYFAIGEISNDILWISYLFFCVVALLIIYRSYFFSYRKNTVLVPTQNDDSFKMFYVAIGIIVMFCAAVGKFVYNADFYKVIIVLAIGIGIISFGVFESPKGWLTIKNNTIRIYGVNSTTDIQHVKEISLYNDRIILINIDNKKKGKHNIE